MRAHVSSQDMLNSVCWICFWRGVERVDGGTAAGRQRTDSTHSSRKDPFPQPHAARSSDHGLRVECPLGGSTGLDSCPCPSRVGGTIWTTARASNAYRRKSKSASSTPIKWETMAGC